MVDATRFQAPQGFVPAGTRLSGIYEIDAPLAKGGMGEVYRGHAIETGDPVAIKLIRADLADNDTALALFRKEASALNRLHNEAIVRYFVFTLDPTLQRHYLAMELVEGISLSSQLERGPLSLADAHGLLTRMASGLQAAHERGIVHRDVSPDNIIIEDGDVAHARIIDFGIARSNRVGEQTVIGSGFAGKYNYVSPEQLGLYGADVTGKSDIYSLGLVIAQSLLGKAIDMGGSQFDIIEKRRRVPDLSQIDVRIRPILERMLAPDPKDRPASMAEIVQTPLATATATKSKAAVRAETAARAAPPRTAKPSTASPAEKSGSMKWVIAALAGLAIVGAGGFVAYLQLADGWKFDTPAPTPNLALSTPALPPPDQAPPAPKPDLAPPAEPAQQIAAVRPVEPLPVPPPVVRPETTPVAAPIRPPPVATPDPSDRILRYIREYNAGDCVLAMPKNVGSTSAEVELYASDPSAFNAFDAAFKKANSFEADVNGMIVTTAQCPALRFIKQLRTQANASVGRLEISKTRIKSGESLEGSFTSDASSQTLLLVDQDGDLHDVSSRLTGSGARKTFAMQLAAGAGVPLPQILLIALGNPRALVALQAKSAAPMPSASFTLALTEATKAGQGAEVAVKYFRIQ